MRLLPGRRTASGAHGKAGVGWLYPGLVGGTRGGGSTRPVAPEAVAGRIARAPAPGPRPGRNGIEARWEPLVL